MRKRTLLTAEQKEQVKKEYRETKITRKDIAVKYNISLSTLTDILRLSKTPVAV